MWTLILFVAAPRTLIGQAISLARVVSSTNGGYATPWQQQAYLDSLNQPSGYQQRVQAARAYQSPSRTYNVAVLSDGYAQHERWKFERLYQRAVAGIRNNEALAETGLWNKMAFYPLFIPSIDSGASHQGYRLYRRTALGATYQEASAQDTTIQVDYNRALSYAQYAGVSVHAVLVLVNDAKYAVSTWANRISIVPDFNQATGPQGTATFEDLLGHEFLGHALGQLWDEYTYGQNKSDPSAWAPNCDRNPQAPKWLALMGWQWVASLWNYIYVGTFPGCTNGQHYRPTRMECRMNLRAHHPFCTVCYHRIAGVLRSF